MRTYIKEFNKKGELINPITKSNPHLSGPSQRKAKRAIFNKERFYGNNKRSKLTATSTNVYFRVAQWVKGKRILHYILKD